ncbi:Mitochondrial outer membrane protein IML2 [Leucoagaricus sp. SymC.cos]|nr:Mitochondrial outer membrane protein IML2 [Leucoagaricus sp. SymC.cos]
MRINLPETFLLLKANNPADSSQADAESLKVVSALDGILEDLRKKQLPKARAITLLTPKHQFNLEKSKPEKDVSHSRYFGAIKFIERLAIEASERGQQVAVGPVGSIAVGTSNIERTVSKPTERTGSADNSEAETFIRSLVFGRSRKRGQESSVSAGEEDVVREDVAPKLVKSLSSLRLITTLSNIVEWENNTKRRLYKTVFPNGIDSYTPLPLPPPGTMSHEPNFTSSVSYSSESSAVSSMSTLPAPPDVPDSKPVKRGFFNRLTSSGTGSTPASNAAHHHPHLHPAKPDGPVDDLTVAGTAFGYGLFNLVFSLRVGFFGFKHDRKLALKALAVAAARNDTHSVFAGIALMTYHGGVLLLSRYQANESRTVAEYQELVDRVFYRFPNGALWILSKAKILQMCHI